MELLEAPTNPPTRYSDRALPAYRHVPGLTPHPVTHPEGHSHGLQAAAVLSEGADALPRGWASCEEYLFGADLFNRAFFWEAHEAWEGLWHAVGHRSEPGRFLQGAIQLSAALLQRHLGRADGCRRLLTKGRARIDSVTMSQRPPEDGRRQLYMGVDLILWPLRVADYIEAEGRRFPFLKLELRDDGAGWGEGR